jgi:CubicO group peptidase (beta-lactamase class C family)
VLGGFPAKFPPGERFSYCNGGFVVLALVAERAGDTPFRELVARNVASRPG